MNEVTLTKHEKQSKGRNGWFHPARVNFLHGPHDTIAIEVWSKNQSGEPPIDLYLTEADALAFANGLLDVLMPAAPAPDPAEPGGNACPKCGGHSFRLQATFDGSVSITFNHKNKEDPLDFEVYDSEPTDSEWDGPASCRNCDWSGTLADLVATWPEDDDDDSDDNEPVAVVKAVSK